MQRFRIQIRLRDGTGITASTMAANAFQAAENARTNNQMSRGWEVVRGLSFSEAVSINIEPMVRSDD